MEEIFIGLAYFSLLGAVLFMITTFFYLFDSHVSPDIANCILLHGGKWLDENEDAKAKVVTGIRLMTEIREYAKNSLWLFGLFLVFKIIAFLLR